MLNFYRDFAKQSYEVNPQEELHGYQLTDAQDRYVVYSLGERHILSIRGTQDAKDIALDFQVFYNKLRSTMEYAMLKDVFQHLLLKGQRVYITAHSLGGTFGLLLAEEFIGEPNFIHAYLFATGYGYYRLAEELGMRAVCASVGRILPIKKCKDRKLKGEKITLIQSKYDPISTLSRFDSANRINLTPNKGINNHTLDSLQL